MTPSRDTNSVTISLRTAPAPLLQVFPLLLGSGARVYPESAEKTTLELVEASALPGGVVLQTYVTTAPAGRAG